ncbi:hypothetical protein ACF0H5_008638 [Mactra antiquata]
MEANRSNATGARPKTSSQVQHSALDSSKQESFSYSRGGNSVLSKMAADRNKGFKVVHAYDEAIRIPCNPTTQQALKYFGVFEDLKSVFRYDLSFDERHVCFRCETETDLDNLYKEYTVYTNRIKIIDISHICPPETWRLFITDNDTRAKYLSEMLKGVTRKYKFLSDGPRLLLYCIGVAPEEYILETLKKCLYYVYIPSDVFHLPMVQQYLNSYKEDVCTRGSVSYPNKKYIFCMRYLKEKIHVLIITDDRLPVEAWTLVLNDNPNRDAELKKHIDWKSDIKFFVHELDGLCMLCISESDGDDLNEAFSRCLCTSGIAHEVVDYPTVKRFLTDNKNDISVCTDPTKPYVTWLYYFSHIKESMAEKIRQLGCRCDNFAIEYLKTSGASLLTGLEEKYKVNASLFEMYIEVEGSKGHAFMEELKDQFSTGVHHSTDTDECKRLMSSKPLKEKLSSIADDNGCCVKFVPFRPFENTYVCKGLTYMSTWYLTHSSNWVSLVSGDMKNTGLDAIIVFVNSSWYGEDPSDSRLPFAPSKKGYLGEIINGNDFGQNMFAVVAFRTAIDSSIQKCVTLNGKNLQRTMHSCYTQMSEKNLRNVGVLLPSYAFDINLNDILIPCKRHPRLRLHFHVCVASKFEYWCQLIDKNLQNECHRRVTYPDIHGIFSIKNDVEVQTSSESLLNIQAECVVVPIDKTLDLSKGMLANLVLIEAGTQLQGELTKNNETPLEHESIVPARPGHLSNKGVKLILFVVIPHWTRCDKNIAVMERLVNKCLLKADRYYCKSIAFPLLGIGNLGYPIRDVVSATLDGIDRYKRESVLQNVSKVTISAPSFKNGPSHKLLYHQVSTHRLMLEKERNEESIRQKEITYLYVDDQNVKIAVVNERNLVHLQEGHFIDVKLRYESGLSNVCLKDATLNVICDKTKEGIQQAMEKVVTFCEENRITSCSLFSCKTGVRMSEYDQVQMITSTVTSYIRKITASQNPMRKYIYLSKVVVVVSDSFDVNSVHPSQMEGTGKSFLSSLFGSNTSEVFTRKTLNTARQYVNTVIIGSSEEQVKDTREKIVEAIHSFKESNEDDYSGHEAEKVSDITDHEDSDEFHSCKEEEDHLVHETKLGNSKNAVDDLRIDDKKEVSTSENTDKNVLDSDLQLLIENSVQASLNSGIMDFLRDSRLESGFYKKWVKWIETNFNVVFLDNDEEPQVEGSLADIIQFENYLDTSFPELPLHCTSDDVSEQIAIDENHFVCPPNTTVHVNMSLEVATKIEGMVLEKVESAFKRNPIFDLKKDKNGLVLTCSVTMARIVKDFVMSVKYEVENINKQSSKFPFDVTECILRYNDITIKVLHDDISKSSTDCIVSPVNARMNIAFGAAHSIAKCAGNDYVGQLKYIVKKDGDMKQNECRTTTVGKLNVIHVHCVSSQLKDADANVLQTYRKAVENCFREASEHKFTSIALPMLGTGQNGIPIDHCAIESYRALSNLKSSPLKEVRFYNKNPKHVSDFSDNLLNCFDAEKTGNFGFMCFQHKHRYIYIVDKLKSHCDYCVDTVYVEVEGTLPATPEKYDKVKVQTVKTSGCTAVKVFVPEWQQDKFLFEQSVSLATSKVLDEANRLHIRYLGITTFEDRVNGNDQHAELIGERMMKSVIEYFQQKGNKIEVLYLMSYDQSVLKKMCSVIMKEIRK